MGRKLIANTKERIGRGICGSTKFRDRGRLATARAERRAKWAGKLEVIGNQGNQLGREVAYTLEQLRARRLEWGLWCP